MAPALGFMVNISKVLSVFKRLSRSETGIERVEVDARLAVVAAVSREDRSLGHAVRNSSIPSRCTQDFFSCGRMSSNTN